MTDAVINDRKHFEDLENETKKTCDFLREKRKDEKKIKFDHIAKKNFLKILKYCCSKIIII